MHRPTEYRLAVFDCDGVILDSNRIKTDAFRSALSGEPEGLIDEFIHYHRTHGGISRYVKIRHFYEDIKKVENPEPEIEATLNRYAGIVRRELLTCPMTPGAKDLLEAFQSLGIPCVVNSGGDELELKDIFRKRGIDRYFTEVFGSPKTKSENMERLRGQPLFEMPAIYFGDALSDLKTAKEFGLEFVFISGVSEWEEGEDYCRRVSIPDYESFIEYCKENSVL